MRARLDDIDVDGQQWVAVSYVPPRASMLAGFTASERAVIELYVHGLSARDIARTRGVSARTIAKQVSSAYRKLNVSSRAALVSRLHGCVGCVAVAESRR